MRNRVNNDAISFLYDEAAEVFIDEEDLKELATK